MEQGIGRCLGCEFDFTVSYQTKLIGVEPRDRPFCDIGL